MRATQVEYLKIVKKLTKNGEKPTTIPQVALERGVSLVSARGALFRLADRKLVAYETEGQGIMGTLRLLAAGKKALEKRTEKKTAA